MFTPIVLAYQAWTYWVFRRRHHAATTSRAATGLPRPQATAVRPVKPLDPRLLRHAAAARRFVGAHRRGRAWPPPAWSSSRPSCSRSGIDRAFLDGAGLAELAPLLSGCSPWSPAAPCSAWAARGRRAPRRAPTSSASCAPGSSPTCCASDRAHPRPAADRRAGHPRHPRPRRARRLLRPLPADAAGRRDRAGHRRPARILFADWVAAVDHRADRAAHPAVHDPRRPAHPARHPPPVAHPGRARPPLPRRRRRARRRWSRSAGPAPRPGGCARLTEEYRRATMRTLRVAFLSALVLELLATLSVALVAVVGRAAAGRGPARPRHRAAGAHARARGLPAAARGRRALPRHRRGPRRGRRTSSRCSRRPTADGPAARPGPGPVPGRRCGSTGSAWTGAAARCSTGSTSTCRPGDRARAHRPQRLRQVHAARRAARPAPARPRAGDGRRRRPRRPRPRRVAAPDRLGAAASRAGRRHGRRQHPARRPRRRRPCRVREAAAAAALDVPLSTPRRRGRRRPVHRPAAPRRAGPGGAGRPAAAAARRAHRGRRRRHRGRHRRGAARGVRRAAPSSS